MNVYKALLILVFTTFSTLTFAQNPAPYAQLDEMIVRGMKDWKVPGLTTVVLKDGKVVFSKTYGVKNIESKDSVDGETLFNMGSTTKAIIAISIGILVDQGRLDWDDKVIDHLPDFRLSDPYITADARVKDLLTHNLGIGNADWLWLFDSLSTSETVKRFELAERVYPLRGGYIYQNIMYAIAGQLIESVSGQHWPGFVNENIFKPLDMDRSQTKSADILQIGNFASPHFNDLQDGLVKVDHTFSDQIGAAGMIWSSTEDIGKYLTFLVNDGVYKGDTLLQPHTFQYLFEPHAILSKAFIYPTATLTNQNWNTYGLGWFQQDYRGNKLDFHTGSLAGMIAIAAIMHDHNAGVYVFANLDHAELRHAIMYKALDLFVFNDDSRDWHQEVFELYSGFRERNIEDFEKRNTTRILGTEPTLDLDKYKGLYENELYGVVKVEVANHQLQITINDFKSYIANHWHFDTFLTNKDPKWRFDIMINFSLNESGKIKELEFWGERFVKLE